MTTLTGHVSPETAYVVEDYPYGFRLRCQMRHWIEYKPSHGFRHVTQTSNPKKPGLVWNKPKAGTYCRLLVLLLDDNGHVTTSGIHSSERIETIDAWAEQYADALTDDHRKELKLCRAIANASARITYTIREVGVARYDADGWTIESGNPFAPEDPAAKDQERNLWRGLVTHEYRKLAD